MSHVHIAYMEQAHLCLCMSVCVSLYVCLSVYREQAHLVLGTDSEGDASGLGIAPGPVGAGEVKDGFAAKSDSFRLIRGYSPSKIAGRGR